MLPFQKRSFRLLHLVLLVLSSVLLAACAATEGPQSTFVARGSSAQAILNLNNVLLVVAAGVFFIVEGMLVYSVVRFRRRPDDGIPLQIHGNKPIEIAWTIVPAIIVLFLATMTFRTQAMLAQPATNPLRVTVIGHQWWWEFQYPDYNVVTANELHIPANRDIQLTLESVDVIHSFWIPQLAGKTDVVPGHVNTMTIRADDTAQPILIRGQCAEYCGGTHAQMNMFAVVEPQATFDSWIRQQQAAAPVPAGVTQAATAEPGATAEAATATAVPPAPAANTQAGGPVAQGYALFQQKGCVGCHTIQGYPNAAGKLGPNLTHVGSRQHIVAGWLQNTPDNMRRWLRDPNEVKPDNYMGTAIKRGTLNENEITALTAYLESLK
ncbi:MAG: cytochrome c oxidase subunit II [Chloroflexota bacterium]|nr:cytochrome c oxidase subunit II [Chloroflexota bacterium]